MKDRSLVVVIAVLILLGGGAFLWFGSGEDPETGLETRDDVPLSAVRGAERRVDVPSHVVEADLARSEDADVERKAVPSEGGSPDEEATGHTLSVLVRFSDGTPVVERQVLLYVQRDFRLVADSETDAEGSVRFPDLPEDVYTAVVLPRATANVRLEGDRREVIELDPGSRVAGRVILPGGEPVGGATVFALTTWRIDLHRPIARTDAEGRFEVRGFREDVEIFARAEGRGESARTRVAALQGREVELILAERGGQVAFAVRDVQGAPARDALVMLVPEYEVADRDGGPLPAVVPRTGRTDDGGQLVFDGLTDGLWSWWIDGGTELEVGEFRLASGEVRKVAAQLEPGATITGVVRDGDGRTVPEAVVLWEWNFLAFPARREARSSADGRFTLTGLPAGSLRVVATKRPREDAAEIAVTAGATIEHDFVLPASSRIVGRCVSDSGEGLRNLFVTARLDEEGPPRMATTVTGEDGSFQMLGVPRRPHVVEVTGGRSSVELATVRWTPESGPLTIVVPAEALPSARLSGEIVDPFGEPVLGDVALRAEGHNVSSLFKLDHAARGRFVFDSLAPRRYLLSYSDGGRDRLSLGAVELAANQDHDMGRIVVDARKGRIVVTLTGAPEDVLTDLYVELEAGAFPRSAKREGTDFVFDEVWAGDHLILIRGAQAARNLAVALTPGETLALDVPYVAGRRCVLRWPGVGGEGIARYALVVEPASGGAPLHRIEELMTAATNEVDEDVRLAPGRYRARVTTPEGRRAEKTFTVAADGFDVEVSLAWE